MFQDNFLIALSSLQIIRIYFELQGNSWLLPFAAFNATTKILCLLLYVQCTVLLTRLCVTNRFYRMMQKIVTKVSMYSTVGTNERAYFDWSLE